MDYLPGNFEGIACLSRDSVYWRNGPKPENKGPEPRRNGREPESERNNAPDSEIEEPTLIEAPRKDCTLKIVLPERRFSPSGYYTTYCIYLQSYSSAFRLHRTETRRRYSDFVWLRKELDKIDNWKSPPPLPSALRFWNLFDPEFVEERRQQLEAWTREVLMDPAYLSHTGLHLFLQTQLSVKQIQDYLLGKISEERIEEIWSHRGHLDEDSDKRFFLNSAHYEPLVISFSPDEEYVDPSRSPPIKGISHLPDLFPPPGLLSVPESSGRSVVPRGAGPDSTAYDVNWTVSPDSSFQGAGQESVDTVLDIHPPPAHLSVPESSGRSVVPCGAGPDSTACDQNWTSTPDSGFEIAGQESSGSAASSPETTTTTALTTEAGKLSESGNSSVETATTILSRVRFQSQESTGQKYSINGD